MSGLFLAKTLNQLFRQRAGRQQVHRAFRRQFRIESLGVIKMRMQPADQRANLQREDTPRGAQKQAFPRGIPFYDTACSIGPEHQVIPLGIVGLILVGLRRAATKFIKVRIFRKTKNPPNIPHCYKNIRLDATGFAFLRAKET